MPAIRPALLKLQVEALVATFGEPERFIRQFHFLLEQYADRTQRQGQSGTPNPLVQSYNAPPPVMRQIIASIRLLSGQNDFITMDLCDKLWDEPILECRTLAAHLLGMVSDYPDSFVLEHVEHWLQETLDDELIRSVIQYGLAHLRHTNPQLVSGLAKQWLNSGKTSHQKAGLIIIETLMDDRDFQNYPSLYLLVTPFIRKAPIELRATLIQLIQSMAERSPQETTYLLQECLLTSESPDTAWLIRRLLSDNPTASSKKNIPQMPEELQKNLRQAIRGQSTTIK